MKPSLLWAPALAAALLSLSTTASAQVDRERTIDSPQNFALELRMGLYYPRIDNEFGGNATPFQDSFGENSRFTIGGEFDWQALRIPYVGTLGPGIGLHFVKFGRPALLDPNSKEPSEEGTNLLLYPMHLQAVLRVDVLAREVGIPLVPYVKGGVGVALWRMTNGNGTAKIGPEGNEVLGRGVSYGPQLGIGLSLLLDWFDEYAARQADIALGVNNTYLFGELVMSRLDNLNGTGLQLGTNMLNFGLCFEF